MQCRERVMRSRSWRELATIPLDAATGPASMRTILLSAFYSMAATMVMLATLGVVYELMYY